MIEFLTSSIGVCATHTASTCTRVIFYLHAYNRGLVSQVSRQLQGLGSVVSRLSWVVEVFFFVDTLGRICRSSSNFIWVESIN